jgi:AraC-like DNA-binding protein
VTWSWEVKLDRTLATSRFLYGVPKAFAAPSFREFLLMIHPEDRGAVERTVARAIRTGGGYSHEYRLILPNGEIRWIRGMASCLYDEHGELTHLVGALIDRTKAVERQAAEPASKATRNILKLIERDWNKDIYLSDIAKRCGVSPRAVQRYFAARGLVSFSRYIKQLRLGRAHGLLCEPKPNTTVLGVALQCGFQNASHFSRDYRNEFGELPSDTLRHARQFKHLP